MLSLLPSSSLSLSLLYLSTLKAAPDSLISIAILGLGGVGRSALLKALASGDQSAAPPARSKGEEEVSPVLTLMKVPLLVLPPPSSFQGGAPVKVQLRVPSFNLTSNWRDLQGIDSVSGVILLYDLTDRDSLTPLLEWYAVRYLPLHAQFSPLLLTPPQGKSKEVHVPEILVGSRLDQPDDRQIPAKKVQDWLAKRKCKAFEVPSLSPLRSILPPSIGLGEVWRQLPASA